MPLYVGDALILRTYKLGEADRIVVFLASDRGKRRGVAKNARRLRSRFSGGLEPFTLVRLAYLEQENRGLVRISYVEPVKSPFVGMPAETLSYTAYFAELVDAWALEGDPSDRVYRLSAAAAAALSVGVPVERVARYFEYWLLRLQGVYPSVEACRKCGATLDTGGAAMAVDAAGFLCPRCVPGNRGVSLSANALAFLRAAAECPPDDLGQLSFSPQTGRELARMHFRMIAVHLDRELRSARVLQSLSVPSSQSPQPESGIS